jgi:hypothetical protein
MNHEIENYSVLKTIALKLGYTVISVQHGKLNCSKDAKKTFHWNPLIDDGDCSRLECEMGISIDQCTTFVCAELNPEDESFVVEYFINHTDKNAAKRVAVVKCALGYEGD